MLKWTALAAGTGILCTLLFSAVAPSVGAISQDPNAPAAQPTKIKLLQANPANEQEPKKKTKEVKQQIIKNGKIETVTIQVPQTIKQKEKNIKKTHDKITINRIVAGDWEANSIEDVRANMQAQGLTIDNLQQGAPYIVQWGDTLGHIAHIAGTSIEQMAGSNGIINPDLIFAGQALRVR